MNEAIAAHIIVHFVPTYVGNVLLKPIIAAAGKDISHWFNAETGDVSA